MRAGRDVNAIVIERTGTALVVRSANADATRLGFAAALPPEPSSTAVVVDASAIGALRALDGHLLGRLEDELSTGAARPAGPPRDVRLVATRTGGPGPSGAPPLAARLADRLGVGVVAPDGDVIALRGGELFSAGPGAGWLDFRGGRRPLWDGPRYPAPAWQPVLEPQPRRTPRRPRSGVRDHRSPRGLRVTAIPAGLWIRAPGGAAPPLSDLGFGIPVEPARPVMLVGAPGEPVPGIADLAGFIESLPAAVGETAVLIWYGREPAACAALARSLADRLGTTVDAYHALPYYAVDGTRRFAVFDKRGSAERLTDTPENVYSPGESRWAPAPLAAAATPVPTPVSTPAPASLAAAATVRAAVPVADTPTRPGEPSPVATTPDAPRPVPVTAPAVALGIARHTTPDPAPDAKPATTPAPATATTPATRPSPTPPATPATTPPATPATAGPAAAGEPLPRLWLAERVSTPEERQAFRLSLGWRHDAAARAVARLLAERPGLRGAGTVDEALVTDLAAVRVFATGNQGQFAESVRRGGREGDRPFAVCVASGLRRLPSLQGVVVRGGPADPHAADAYVPGRDLAEEAPLVALDAADAVVPGAVEVLIWSVTARRLDGLAGDDETAEVVFLPGTVFRVLAVDPSHLGEQHPAAPPDDRRTVRRVLLAEVPPGKAGPAGTGWADRALARLNEAAAARAASPRPAADAAPTRDPDRFVALPGDPARVSTLPTIRRSTA